MANPPSRRNRLADIITAQDSTIAVCCDQYFKSNLKYRILHPYKKYSEYVCSGCRYEREFVSKEDWLKLDRAREKIKSEIQASEGSIGELSSRLCKISNSLSDTIIKLKQLKRQAEFLDNR
jgi:hypothetical protein